MSEIQYRIPDLLQSWPWGRLLSPYYADAKRESSAWVESFRPFDRRGQKSFNACDLNLLASLTYSNRNKEFVRLGCDLMNFYFVYDEYTDVADPIFAGKIASMVIEAMRYPDRCSPASHILVGMTRDFWKQAHKLSVPGSPCFDHFIATSDVYFRAVTQEAHDREEHRIRSLDDYMDLRRNTSGARPTTTLIEFGLDLPEYVTSHPTIVSLTEKAVDLIVLVNDMHSYVREISCGLANHNIITVIMHERNLDLQAALDFLGIYANDIASIFLADLERVPSWGPELDERVQVYIEGLGQWVRGNDDWSCEGKRYHGNDGMKIKETRLISILPREGNYLVSETETALSEASSLVELEGSQSVRSTGWMQELRAWWDLLASGKILTRFMRGYSTMALEV
ncbi:terpenoid synthase [Pholiota conissans]|uniref:Terpene synthase n=1 Tax=Pholiota conissans TaxID=109636 RepID=A0A9P6D309_9AGAR|nr:terpenoid synthase [Pholiota conissans]